MIKRYFSSVKTRLLSSSRLNFISNQDGIAAIEFALVAPIMLAMYFGLAEIATTIAVDRKISHSANVAGDLSTQYERISPGEMGEIMTATMLVMSVSEKGKDTVSIEIASYARDPNDNSLQYRGKATFKGSDAAEDFPTLDAENIDQRLLSSSSGVVVARVKYLYEPIQLRYLPTELKIRETFMLKPRKSLNVDIHKLANDGSLESDNYSCNFNAANKVDCSPSGTLTQPSNSN